MWGQHLILDMAGCDRTAITDRDTIAAFCRELIASLDMKAFGAPLIERFAAHDQAAAGYSLVQLIETSNICAHFAENTGEAYLDVFSCKPYSEDTAIAVARTYFRPTSVKKMTLVRDAGQADDASRPDLAAVG